MSEFVFVIDIDTYNFDGKHTSNSVHGRFYWDQLDAQAIIQELGYKRFRRLDTLVSDVMTYRGDVNPDNAMMVGRVKEQLAPLDGQMDYYKIHDNVIQTATILCLEL